METLLITKLTTKSYLQFISLKKLYSQNTIYNSFRLKKKKRHLISIEKIIPLKIYIFEKNNSIKKNMV